MIKKISLPRISFTKPDLSKINLRKINWLTIMAIFSYLHVLVLIPLIFGRKSPFVQFHAQQGTILLFVWVLLSLSFYLPIVPWIFILYIAFSMVFGIVNVVTGKEKPLPLIGKLFKAD